MPIEYTIYTLQVQGNTARSYEIQSDHKTDKTIVSPKLTAGDQEILTLVWNFLTTEPEVKTLLPRGVQVATALRKHLVVERDPDFTEFLYIKDGRTMLPILKLEEITLAQAPASIPLTLPTLTQRPATTTLTPKSIPVPSLVTDTEMTRNRRLIQLVTALLQQTTAWGQESEAEHYQFASGLVVAALKDEQFSEVVAQLKSGIKTANISE